ncbi:MAG: hypothetical protein RR356_01120 [Bacteroidales bacterium]
MKRIFLLSALMAVIAALAVSCAKSEEDLYKPKCRIEKITESDGDVTTFVYDKKTLTKMVDANGNYVTLQYNKDKTVNEMTGYRKDGTLTGEVAKMSYTKGKIVLLELYENKELIEKYEFIRSGNHFSKIKVYKNLELRDQKEGEKSLITKIFACNPMTEMMAKVIDEKGVTFQYDMDITYTGDNITRVSREQMIEGGTMKISIDMTYDSYHNPYYGLPFAFEETSSYSANNVLTLVKSYSFLDGNVIKEESTYKYTYNNQDFPTEIQETDEGITDVTSIQYIE